MYLGRLRSGVQWLRDERVVKAIAQVAFVLAVFLAFRFFYTNMITALAQRGLLPSFYFLRLTAGFDIGEKAIEYSRAHTYARAFLVGIINTLVVSFWGILFATIIGVIVGLARLSRNFVIRTLATIYVEGLRNIPLLVLLVFWYTGVFLKFPPLRKAKVLWNAVYLSNRGVVIPWPTPTALWSTYVWVLVAGLVAAVAVSIWLVRVGRRTGRMPLVPGWALLTFLAVALVGWFLMPQAPLTLSFPKIEGFRTVGGRRLTPEFMALLSGLVIYTSAYIGEVVRAGIQSVPKGQYEAARALGLTPYQMTRLIIFPQALRVIVPPLTSQYLNLTKNSSLAVYIGYPDLYSVSGTIYNQTGRAVEVTLLMMAVYLTFSLTTSLFMNWYNRKIRFVER